MAKRQGKNWRICFSCMRSMDTFEKLKVSGVKQTVYACADCMKKIREKQNEKTG